MRKTRVTYAAPYCDVQDANEMRTVENAKQNETYGTSKALQDADN